MDESFKAAHKLLVSSKKKLTSSTMFIQGLASKSGGIFEK
jgi:hypothetical protein